MREYKFRAWYIPGKVMVYPEWNEEGGSFFFDVPTDHTIKSVILGHVIKKRSFKVMLCVGLRDRKGREIYEYDIVRRWIRERELKALPVEHTPQFWWDNVAITQFEVIGNVFERPTTAGPPQA